MIGKCHALLHPALLAQKLIGSWFAELAKDLEVKVNQDVSPASSKPLLVLVCLYTAQDPATKISTALSHAKCAQENFSTKVTSRQLQSKTTCLFLLAAEDGNER
eukprot:scpid19258/ scgid31718/ 